MSDLYHEERGRGPSILLIPPSGSTASTWGTLADLLVGLGRVIVYDRRGYGRSGGSVVRSAAVHTADAATLFETLDAAPAMVVGTSAGATIALPEQWRRTARENGRSVVADLRATLGSYPSRARLATMSTPVVCTFGSRSRNYMRAITRALSQAIPTATVRQVDGAAHAVPFDAPAAFSQIIADQLHATEPPS